MMNVISSFIMSSLEKELVNVEPQVADFLIAQIRILAQEILIWVENKTHLQSNGEGIIGASLLATQ